MELSDRFKYIMKLNQLSASAFAEQIGVQRSSVSHVLSGRNKPSLEFIQKVLRSFPKVDANWLVNGSTEVDKDQFKLKSNTVDQSKDELTEVRKIDHGGKAEESRQKGENASNSLEYSNLTHRTIQKVLVFYTDGTFEELNRT